MFLIEPLGFFFFLIADDAKFVLLLLLLRKEVEEVEEEEEEEEEEVFEYNIDNKTYYVTNKLNSAIYELLEDGDVGDEIGKIINGQVKWD